MALGEGLAPPRARRREIKMTPERFRQIEQLAALVLQQEESERAAFLDKACLGDRGLRQEVESLLASDQQAGNFLMEPAAQLVAERLSEDPELASKEAGAAVSPSMLGRYRGERELGGGGMGLLYGGDAAELGREVAVKLVRPEGAGNPD